MSNEHFDSPNEVPENIRGLHISDILDFINKSDSPNMLMNTRNEITENLFIRDLNDDELDVIACIDYRLAALRAIESKEHKKQEAIAKEQAERALDPTIVFWALTGRFHNSDNDIQLAIEEDARIALFKNQDEQR